MATFGMLHGAWHDASCWEAVAHSLEALGHDTVAPDLPLHNPAADHEDRASPAIEALEGTDEPVVVVAHSQSSALGPIVAAARPVSLLVYVCPRLSELDAPQDAPKPFRDGFPFPQPGQDGTSAWDPDTAVKAMYKRLSADVARTLAERLRPMAMPSGDYPLEELPRVPTELIYAAEDEIFEPVFERFMAREILDIDPIELDGGHFPMAEDPGGLADLLDRLATAHVKQGGAGFA